MTRIFRLAESPFSWVILALPPMLLGAILLHFCGWNVVFGDEISMCGIFDRYFRGTLTFSDLWQAYQNHRIFVPRVVQLLLGSWSQWNVNYEIALIFLLSLGSFWQLARLLYRSREVLPAAARFPLLLIVSAFVFSTNQHGNWSNGFQICAVLSVLCILIGLNVLSASEITFARLALAILMGTLASYSFGNGFLYWIVCLPTLAARLWTDRLRKIKAGLWLLAAGVVIFFYFYRWDASSIGASLGQSVWDALARPWHFSAYLFTYLGSPMFHLNGSHAQLLPPLAKLAVSLGPPLFGLAGLAAFLWLSLRLIRENLAIRRSLTPWWSLASYTLMSAAMTMLARANTSAVAGGLSSQYVTFGQFLWLALFVLAAALLGKREAVSGWQPSRKTVGVLLAVLAGCYAISYANGVRKFAVSSALCQQIRAELLSQTTPQTWSLINTAEDPAKVARDIEILREHRLATFAPKR